MLNKRLIEQSVENLCRKGCKAVWADIGALEVGRRLPETAGLSSAERQAVIDELKAVMAVYEGSCAAT
jgi:hypothetical protein